MRILCLTDGFLPTIGGAEVAVHNLAEGLVSLGNEVLVCTTMFQQHPAHLHQYELERYWLPRGAWKLGFLERWIGWHLVRSINRWHPDVVQVNYAWPGGYAAILNKQSIKVPVTITSHGSDIQRIPEIGYGCRLDPKINRKVIRAVHQADALIAISKDIYHEYIELGVKADSIALIPNGINYQRLSVRDETARLMLGISPERIVILAVGRNHPKKGFIHLIHAMAAIAVSCPQALCLIVGKEVSSLAPVVEQAGLIQHVNLYEQVLPVGIEFSDQSLAKEEQIETFFKAADIYAMPSLIEGLPLVALEAMACGLPIVATLPAAGDDLVTAGANGILVPVGDVPALAEALNGLLKDASLRAKMGTASRLVARAYDRVNVAAQHVQLFKTILGALVETR